MPSHRSTRRPRQRVALVLLSILPLLAGGIPAVGQSCTVHEATLTAGDLAGQDGAVQVTVDAAGWFGSASLGGRQAIWNPPGPVGPTGVATESLVIADGVPLRECVEVAAQVQILDDSAMISSGRVAETDFRLIQVVVAGEDGHPARLVQRYELTPRKPATASLQVQHRARLVAPGQVGSAAGQRGLATRAGGFLGTIGGQVDAAIELPLVGITGDLDGNPAPTRWAVTDGRPADPAQSGVGLDDANRVEGDGDGDGWADAAQDPVLRQTWVTRLSTNDTVVFTVSLELGVADPVLTSRAAANRIDGRRAPERPDRSDDAAMAAAVARLAYPPSGSETVVVTRSDAYADALAGAPLAHRLAAPLLLTPSDSLAPEAREVIRRLRATTAVILGGPGAISPAVEGHLSSAGITQIERISGADRFRTAVAIADRLLSLPPPAVADSARGEAAPAASPARPLDIFLVEGDSLDPGRGWPDAVAISALAAVRGRPILLTLRDHLPPATATAMRRLTIREAVIVGGTAAVSDDVQAEVERMGVTTRRIAGVDRYATAAEATREALTSGQRPQTTVIASGGYWPEALVSGVAAAALDATLVLVPPRDLAQSEAATSALSTVGSFSSRLIAVGDATSLSSTTLDQATRAVADGHARGDAHGIWSGVPTAPIPGHSSAVSVWTGEEFIVWGGLGTDIRTGAGYDPATRTWRSIARAPFNSRPTHRAVWGGGRMFIWGSSDGFRTPVGEPDVPGRGSYDPATDRWRVLPAAPLPVLRESLATWTGSELLVLGTTDQNGDEAGPLVGAAFDPEAGTWRTIPDPPLNPRLGWSAVFTDEELVVTGGVAEDVFCQTACTDAEAFRDGAAYDPSTDTWRSVASAPTNLGGRAIWTGDEMIVLGGVDDAGRRGLAFDPATDSWRFTAPPPPGATVLGAAVWTGTEILTWSHPTRRDNVDRGGAYDPAADAWTVLPTSGALARERPTSAWAGDRLLIWGGFAFEPELMGPFASGLAYQPSG